MTEESSEDLLTDTLILGKNPDNDEYISLPAKALKRHVAIFGQSGSGKTVACKVIIEEAVKNGIPAIIIDPQGDICSMSQVAESEILEKYGLDKDSYETFKDKLEVVLLTPGSEKGVPLSINPLVLPPKELDYQEKVLTLDGIANNISEALGYKISTERGREIHTYLVSLLEHCMKNDIEVEDFEQLIELIDSPTIPSKVQGLISSRMKSSLIKNLRFLTVGANALIFKLGAKLSIPNLIKPAKEGKVRLSIIFLNTLTSQRLKKLYISTIAQNLYTYILTNPSTDPQMIFYIDELAGLIPPYPRNPPTKKWLQLLFRQARKYGLALLVATQNISDVDYKAFDQVKTFLYGGFQSTQNRKIVEKMLESYPEASYIADKLAQLKQGEFYLLSSQFYKEPVRLKTRWLYTTHETLTDNDIEKLYDNPPETLAEEVGEYVRSVETMNLDEVSDSLSLDDLEAELTGLGDIDINGSIDGECIEEDEGTYGSDDLADLLPELSDLNEGEVKDTQTVGASVVKTAEHKTAAPEVEIIDLSKIIKSMKNQYVKYEPVDFKSLMETYFDDENIGYLGMDDLSLVYVPFLLVEMTIKAKRYIMFEYAGKKKEEKIELELPIKRLFPLIDKISLQEEKEIWGLKKIPLQSEEVFGELISILPMKNLGSLYAPRSSNILQIEPQKKASNILESFQDVLLNDYNFYKSEWQKVIEQKIDEIEYEKRAEIIDWMGELKEKRDNFFSEIQAKRAKVNQYKNQIDNSKAIYATLKPLMGDKFKYKSQRDQSEFQKAKKYLTYGPKVIQNYIKELETDLQAVKEIDDKLKKPNKVTIVQNVDDIISSREFTIPTKKELVDIYAAIVHIPISLAKIALLTSKGQENTYHVIAESALGSNISIACDTCLDKKAKKMNFVTTPNTCSVCERVICYDHIILESTSNKKLCSKHARICSICKRIVSSETIEQCDFCRNVLCTEHTEKCSECGKIICKDHTTKKVKKGLFKSETLYLCPKHS